MTRERTALLFRRIAHHVPRGSDSSRRATCILLLVGMPRPTHPLGRIFGFQSKKTHKSNQWRIVSRDRTSLTLRVFNSLGSCDVSPSNTSRLASGLLFVRIRSDHSSRGHGNSLPQDFGRRLPYQVRSYLTLGKEDLCEGSNSRGRRSLS